MIESDYPEINTDKLIKEIVKEVERYQNPAFSESDKLNGRESILVSKLSHIEALLKNAEFNSSTPTKWPDGLNRFPFKNKSLQKFLFKLYSFLFKKQKVVNFSLIQALSQSLELNQQLVMELKNIKRHLKLTEDRLIIAEKQIESLAKDLNSINSN